MKRRSLVLVTVDCLRADHVGSNRYSRPLTPFLDSLAGESIVLSNAMVAGVPTYFSFPAIMASRYSLGLGREVLGLAPGEPSIATVLRDGGYETAAFIAGNPYLGSRSGYEQGFDQFQDFLDSDLPTTTEERLDVGHKSGLSELNRQIHAVSHRSRATGAAYDELYFWYCQWRSGREELSMDQLRRYPAADIVVQRACSWLNERRDEPFFLWIHLMDPHHPYYPRQDALEFLGLSHLSSRRARFLNSFWNRGDIGPQRLQAYRPEVMALYDAGVHWVDKQISYLAALLQESGRWDETVFVVTADHGEEFLEHGKRYHSPENLPEQLVHVPLLIRVPQVPARGISGPFSMIHLAPTLLESLGTASPGSFQGRSRWPHICAGELPLEAAVTECIDGCHNPFRAENRLRPRLLAVRDSRYKLVIRFADQEEYLYDLKSDPGEKSPLPKSVEHKARASLLQLAAEHLRNERLNRNVHLALSARLRQIAQSIEIKTPAASRSVEQGVLEISRHG